ncbi:MAG: hypothetical protein MUE65_05525, partial [Methanomassiliicoccales archaeon]|nr:hypothetical protein [Methanomassiliicoccales archaeon]
EPKYRALTVNWYQKVEPIAAKYGIKFLGSYDDHAMHTVYVLFDTPSMDVLLKFMMEPEIAAPLAFCTGRVFPVFDHKTTLSLIQAGHG